MDQRAVGRTPRANPLTYTKAFDPIRRLLADTADARRRGFGPGHFSFNVARRPLRDLPRRRVREGGDAVPVGRLSSPARTAAAAASGRRCWRWPTAARPIADILDLTVDQALGVLRRTSPRPWSRPCSRWPRSGLGYIRLGQPHQHPVRRRGPAAEALALPARRRRPRRAQALHLRRAHHRPALRGHRHAAGCAAAPGRRRPHGAGDRAQHGRGQDRRLGDRPRPGGRRGGRPRSSRPGRRRRSPPTSAPTPGRFLKAYLERRRPPEAGAPGRPAGWPSAAAAYRGPAGGARRSRSRGAREHNLQDIEPDPAPQPAGRADRASPARASPPWPSTSSSPRASAATWRAWRPTSAST
ncbi:MAG: hypothetical protein MZV70_55660 [Desulfobacterales bacterium]|nr:hypothetical protein [Desulfobacterales bacterium]